MSDHFTDAQIKHLEFIQATVARLANNSFLIRGWAITLTGVLIGIAINGEKPFVAFTSLVPTTGFWLLDGFYLRQERLHRKLYEATAREGEEIPTFSMDVSSYVSFTPWRQSIFSATLSLFYAPLALISILVGLLFS